MKRNRHNKNLKKGNGMILESLTVGAVSTNCYIAGCSASKKGVIIDPGDNAGLIIEIVNGLGLEIIYILNTHGHFDHVLANGEIKEALGADLAIHPADAGIMMSGGGAAFFGMDTADNPAPDIELSDGQELYAGELCLRVLHTPGHSPGSVSFYESNEGIVFDGDLLFAGGIGRTDLPGGSQPRLFDSIYDKILTLPDETRILPGHGPETTVSAEKRMNPFLIKRM